MLLLGRPSSINVRKVMWTAAEIGLEFDHEEEWGTPAAAARKPDLLRLNPHGLIPVWVDDLGSIWESNTICRYLASRHGRHDLLPSEPFPRALVERWMDWQASDLNHSWVYAFSGLVRGDPKCRDEALVTRSAQAWNALMAVLDRRLGETGAFVTGADFTLADVVLGLSAHRWLRTPIEHAPCSNVVEYLNRLSERAAFRRLATPELP
jgi:glutathione S-transferase